MKNNSNSLKKDIGFVLGPKTRMSGALSLNSQILEFISRKLPIVAIPTENDFFYQVESKVGYVLNYMTNFSKSDRFEKIVATNVGCLPFLEKSKVICIFHSVDSSNYKILLDSLGNAEDMRLVNKWIEASNGIFSANQPGLESDYNLIKSLEKFVAKKSSKIIVVSEKVKHELVHNFKVDAKKIKVILNGVDDFWFEERQYSKKPALVFTSRVDDSFAVFLIKGLDRLLQIFSNKKLKNIQKKVYIHTGSQGPIKTKKISKFIASVTNAEVKTNLNGVTLGGEYLSGDIFLCTSRAEACQLTLIEAMASGMIPVCYSSGIVDEYIKDGVNGFVVANVKDAIKTISEIAGNDRKRESISREAKKTANAHFKSKRMLDAYLENIDRFCGEK